MNNLDEVKDIKNSFILIDDLLQSKLLNENDEVKRVNLEKSIKFNSVGHFVTLFSVFENWIETEYRDLIGNPMEVYFMERVEQIVTSKSDIIIINSYYATRCSISHGRVKKVQTIDVLAVAKNLMAIIERGAL
jgi:hypothetical protein